MPLIKYLSIKTSSENFVISFKAVLPVQAEGGAVLPALQQQAPPAGCPAQAQHEQGAPQDHAVHLQDVLAQACRLQ